MPNDGFFKVVDANGNEFLTRDGSFAMTDNGGGNQWELVNGAGEYVLDYDGNHIPVPFKIVRQVVPQYDEEGKRITPNEENGLEEQYEEVQSSEVDYDALQQAIGVFTVPNNWGLDNAEKNHFKVTPRSGEAEPNPDLDKVREALEMSTVDLAGDMVHIITTQRAYQMAAKIVQTSDEFIRIANNLRG